MRCTPQIRRLARGWPPTVLQVAYQRISQELMAGGVEKKELPTTACKSAQTRHGSGRSGKSGTGKLRNIKGFDNGPGWYCAHATRGTLNTTVLVKS